MPKEKNEINELIDNVINNSNDLVQSLKSFLPSSISESILMIQESNISNLKKIKEFLNK